MSRPCGGRREVGDIESYPHCELRRSPRKPIADAVDEIAKRLGMVPMEAKAKLIEALSAGLIRAYWRSDGSLIANHCWRGADIDIERQTVILPNDKRMTFVDLDRDDYEAWFAKIAAPVAIDLPAKGQRYVEDDALVAEGVEGLRAHRWPNANRAATALAERAPGTATWQSKVDRLYRKIQAARDSGTDPRNIPKHPE